MWQKIVNLDERSWFILQSKACFLKRAGDGNIVKRIVLRYSKIKHIVIVSIISIFIVPAGRVRKFYLAD